MVQTESCALCLTSESKWFLEVFCEDNQEKDIALIISKHLWFELNASEHSYVCAECWKSVNDFHEFYTKLENIHSQNQDDSNSCIEKTLTQHQFEFHPVETIKVEEPDDFIDDVEQKLLQSTEAGADNTTDTGNASNRPKRTSVTKTRYKMEASDSEWEKDFLATNDEDEHDDDVDYDGDVKNDIDDNDDSDVINYDALNKVKQETAQGSDQAENDTAEILTESIEIDTLLLTPKRGRGRPPKIKSERKSSPLAGSSETKKQHKRARKRMISFSSSESDADYLDDYDEQYDSKEWKKYRKDDRRSSKRSPGSRLLRDKRIFSYVDEFICYYCPEKILFERFHHANQHYKQVHNEPAFLRCPKCGKKCFTPGGFVSHMETHEDPERNKCKICGKMTDQQITLKKHMRAHQEKLEKNYPFPCSQCSRRFEFQGKRDKHERLHGRKVIIKKEKGRDLELLAFYKRIYCEVCEDVKPESTSFDNFWDLKVHMGNEHNKSPYLKCPICFKKNACRQQLMVHVDVHNNPDHYRCEVCKEIHHNLDKHMIKAHTPETIVPEEKNYSCEHCGKTFKFQTNLRSHIDRVHGEKDVSCNICNKYFNHKALSAHKRSAHTDEMFMCEHCPKMFKTRSGLESHKGDHDETQRKSVKCHICGKEMRRGASMAKHMKTIHSQEDPVNCNLCGKVFRTSFHMMRHRANTCAATINSRPYKCEVCGKGFAMKLTMTEHMTTHTRTSLYQCAFCFKTFGYISNLYKHRKKAHPLEWQEVQARPEQGIATVIEIRN
ncbi:zinc finger protein 492-like [Anopheles nili]|uniref:zinc finger protein 492-like n=1 Tax=Anopheles nili TaxID=185578 RepID=UPI00237C29F7|nr:zinc finger protein 492-like [Anopheles nili]